MGERTWALEMTCMRKTSASRGLEIRQSAVAYSYALFEVYAGNWLGEQAVVDRPTIIAKGTEDQVLALLIEDQDT